MVIDGFDSERHDRFQTSDVTEEFLGDGLNFSGVGRRADGRWGTMISPSHFVTSNHLAATSGEITFHLDNNPAGQTVACDISTAMAPMRVGVTDFRIGSLDLTTCVDENNVAYTSELPYYDIAPAVAPGGYDGSTVYHVGDSTTQYGADATTDMSVGRNIVSFETNVTFTGLGTDDWLIYKDDSLNGSNPTGTQGSEPLSVGPIDNQDETYFVGGDSGGPSFIVNGSDLELIGIHSFVSWVDAADGFVEAFDSTRVRRVSGDILLPSSASLIQAKINPVPEPSQGLAIGCLIGFYLLATRVRPSVLSIAR